MARLFVKLKRIEINENENFDPESSDPKQRHCDPDERVLIFSHADIDSDKFFADSDGDASICLIRVDKKVMESFVRGKTYVLEFKEWDGDN